MTFYVKRSSKLYKFMRDKDIHGNWLSPNESEREMQIHLLKSIFPSFNPDDMGYALWQYMNSLIHYTIEHKKCLKNKNDKQ